MTSHYPRTVWEHQTEITYSQAMTQNQWYDIWDNSAIASGAGSTKKDCKISSVGVKQLTGNEDIVISLVVDNKTYTGSFTCVADTEYNIYPYTDGSGTTLVFDGTLNVDRAYVVEGRSIQFEVRKTTALGANALEVSVDYAAKPE